MPLVRNDRKRPAIGGGTTPRNVQPTGRWRGATPQHEAKSDTARGGRRRAPQDGEDDNEK